MVRSQRPAVLLTGGRLVSSMSQLHAPTGSSAHYLLDELKKRSLRGRRAYIDSLRAEWPDLYRLSRTGASVTELKSSPWPPPPGIIALPSAGGLNDWAVATAPDQRPPKRQRLRRSSQRSFSNIRLLAQRFGCSIATRKHAQFTKA
eukprot:12012727-Alexandrium_andersonii.AAC.1